MHQRVLEEKILGFLLALSAGEVDPSLGIRDVSNTEFHGPGTAEGDAKVKYEVFLMEREVLLVRGGQDDLAGLPLEGVDVALDLLIEVLFGRCGEDLEELLICLIFVRVDCVERAITFTVPNLKNMAVLVGIPEHYFY